MRRVAYLACLAAIPACSTSVGADDVSSAAAIIDGHPSTSRPAVVGITRGGATHCTGTVVAPTYVLTAGHCLSSWNATELQVWFNAPNVLEPPSSAEAIGVRRSFVHPNYHDAPLLMHDLGILELERPAPVAPQEVFPGELSQSVVGLGLGVVGYGRTFPGDRRPGVKLETLAKILELTPNELVHEAKTCPGDSGGPGFLNWRGREVLVAVHSSGSCGQGVLSKKTRVDSERPFLEPFLAAQTGEPARPIPVAPHVGPSGDPADEVSITYSGGTTARHEFRCLPSAPRLQVEFTGAAATVYLRHERAVAEDAFDLSFDAPTFVLTGSDDMYPGIWNVLTTARASLAGTKLVVRCRE